MNRKNQCGAVMAATLRLADVRPLAGVTLVGTPRCLIGRWQAQNETPSDERVGTWRGARGRRGQRAASGREALTPTEIKIAALVAGGDPTSDIARGMFVSRRTVRTYISRILAKLGAKGRVEIVREALRQGVSP